MTQASDPEKTSVQASASTCRDFRTCDSWYRHPVSGRIASNWPGGTDGYVARTHRREDADFVWS